MFLKVGELAKRAGLTVRALHHYDRVGLLSPSARSESGHRLYTRADVVRLHRIQALKQFGYTLADIGEFLSESRTAPLEILTRQIGVLDERMRHAHALRERLSLLKERMEKGEETGLTDWLTLLELMTMYEKHLSQEELETFRANKAAGGLDEEWRKLVRAVRESIDRGTAPESPEARELAIWWLRLLRSTTGNDPVLAAKLNRIHRAEEEARLLSGITPELIDYLTQALARAREAVLLQYLSPEEMETVRARRAAHKAEWPPLLAELRRLMDRGAAPGDPEAQVTARRLESLLRASYWGDDPELEGKVRSAFRSDPDLLAPLGLDAPLRDFLQRAGDRFRNERGSGENRTMPAPKPSAFRVAVLRAVHQLLDRPLVFEDPLALKILGAAEEESLRRDPSRYDTPLFRGLRSSVVVRSRFAEDERVRAIRRGVRQVLIPGAGLDTTAYRDEARDGGRVFEADLPETQRWKRECLRAAGIAEPGSVTFVPLDMESVSLFEALGRAGFRREEPAFVMWLGVTMYLREEAVREMLRFVGSLAPGSGVAFDYAVLPSLLSPRELRAMEAISARTSQHGEPWKTFFDPGDLDALLCSLGFHEVNDLSAEQLNERYLSGRADGLRKSGTTRLVYAGV